jgi:hypothetical protein
MTVAELISQVLRRLNELDPDNPVHWTREEILVFVNDAVIELNLIAWEFHSTVSDAINAADNIYDCPDSILAITSVRVGNKYLFRGSLSDLDLEVKWEESGANRLNVTNWSPVGLDKYLIYPRPLSAGTAYLESLIEPTVMEDDDDALPVRPEYEAAIENYVVERATFKSGGAELNQVAALYAEYLDSAKEISGRNILRQYPRYAAGVVDNESMRENLEAKPSGN